MKPSAFKNALSTASGKTGRRSSVRMARPNQDAPTRIATAMEIYRSLPMMSSLVDEAEAEAVMTRLDIWPNANEANVVLRLSSTNALAKQHTTSLASRDIEKPYTDKHQCAVEALGGYMAFGNLRVEGYIIWSQPVTPYLESQARLYLAAVDVITCTSAGQEADTLHDHLAAEARLASYNGFRVRGADGTTPEQIERDVMRECQAIVAADMLASTPEVVEP